MTSSASDLPFLRDGGEMGARIRAHDWVACGFGKPQTWPPELQTLASICLNSEVPTAIYWGPELRLLYNDAWSPIPAGRHPWALGRPAKQVWPDIWEVIEPQLMQVMTSGEGFQAFDQVLFIQRDGKPQETYWNYSFTPIVGSDGSVLGIFNQGNETTAHMLARRERDAQVERLRVMFQQAPGAVALVTGEHHIYEIANEAYLQLVGDRSIIGKSVAEALPEIIEQGFVDLLDRVYRSGEPFVGSAVPVRLQRQAGASAETRLLDFVFQPIRDARGEVTSIFVQATDVTDRVRAEHALRASEERLSHALSAGGGIGTWDWDVRNDVITADERFANLYGVDPDRAATGVQIYEFYTHVHPDDVPALKRAIGHAIATGENFFHEYRLMANDSSIRWVLARGRCSLAPDGTPIRFPGVAFDITERKVAEEALRAARRNRDFLLSLVHRQRELMDPDAVLQSTARALGERLGADRVGFFRIEGETAEIRAVWASGVLPTLTDRIAVASLGAGLQDAARAGDTIAFGDCRLDKRIDPDAFLGRGVIAGMGIPLIRAGRWEGGLFVHHSRVRHWRPEEVALAEEVAESAWESAERASAGLALRDSEERFRVITNSIDQMIWSTRPDGYHDYYNDRWYEYTGVPYGSTDGEGWNHMFHPEDQERAWSVWRDSLASGKPYHIEYRLRHRSGHYRWVLGRAQPMRNAEGRIVRWFGTCTDIQDIVDAREVLARSREDLEREVSERTHKLMQAEERLRQAQKMEAIGQLTGGIAHDFNNMLAVIQGALSLLRRRLARGDTDVGKYIDGAIEGANRASALTQRLLAFARQQPLSPVPIDANRMVGGMVDLIARSLGENIRMATHLAADLWPVRADANQLENVMLNLAVNARDAMPNGGRLTIETLNAKLDQPQAQEFSIAPGEYVLLRVIDTGAGMTREVMAKAFEPFFTTKEVGKGTGLGLSQVFGFVRQSGGHVKIQSEVGAGTTINVYLPRYYGTLDAPAPTDAPRALVNGRPQEVVLVVEDEARVRSFSVEALRELGYTVLAAESPKEALRIIDSGQRVDVLFTDIVMPEMTGPQLAEAATARVPSLKVLFTTGYSRNAVADNGIIDPATNFLPKPFGIEQLATKIRSAFDSSVTKH